MIGHPVIIAMKHCLLLSISLLMTLSTLESGAQDLAPYRWEKRIVLLLTEDAESAPVKHQLQAFESDPEGMDERKLLVITATPKAYRIGPGSWQKSTRLYKKHHRLGGFEFILIGLDGGLKLRRQKEMSLKELYRIIDSMPMRTAEMRGKNN